MKTMSVDEILKIHSMPKGVYRHALYFLHAQIQVYFKTRGNKSKKIKSMCAAFSSLYALTQGEYVSKKAVIDLTIYAVENFDITQEEIDALPTIGTEEK